MKAPVLRLLSGFVMMVAAAATTHAQAVLLNIDWSNLSAVKITATGNFPAFSYNNPGDTPEYGGIASSFKGEDGMTFVNFLTSTSATTGDVGPGATTSNLADHSGDSIFDQFYVLSGAQGGSLKDLNIYAATTTDNYLFANGAAAFTGEAVFDLSGVAHADLVSLFPGLGASGSLVMWNTFSYPIGTWTVTGAAAIPEPSTYAAIFGGLALVGVALRRRQAARS